MVDGPIAYLTVLSGDFALAVHAYTYRDAKLCVTQDCYVTLGVVNTHPETSTMSMLCSLYRITPEQVTRRKDFPDADGELVGFTAPPPKISFLSKLFGKSPKQPPPSERRFEAVAKADTFELNQAWHILPFLFSGTNAEGP